MKVEIQEEGSEGMKLINKQEATNPCFNCSSKWAIGEVYCPECGRMLDEYGMG